MLTGDAAADDPAAEDPATEDAAADDDLISTVEVIEQQALETRAASYAALVDVLARQLESAPPPQ